MPGIALPQYGNVTVSIFVINVYNFDYKTGSYTFDYYLNMEWTDTNITNVDWYMMNGPALDPELQDAGLQR